MDLGHVHLVGFLRLLRASDGWLRPPLPSPAAPWPLRAILAALVLGPPLLGRLWLGFPQLGSHPLQGQFYGEPGRRHGADYVHLGCR
jgi:hypothetical protein